jgi:hypothetical protein
VIGSILPRRIDVSGRNELVCGELDGHVISSMQVSASLKSKYSRLLYGISSDLSFLRKVYNELQ